MYNISIVIPHYNSPDTLERLLNSIGNHSDVEVIVVDDRSTKLLDEYRKCLEHYEGSNVFFHVNDKPKKGAGTSRNVGLDYARGKWLLFADADDFFLDNWYDCVKKYLDSDYDAVFFAPEGDYVNGAQTDRHVPYLNFVNDYIDKKDLSDLHIRFQFFPPWSKMIKKKLVDENQIQFDETMYSNDVMFSTKMGYYAKKIMADRNSIYCLSEKSGSLTKQVSFESVYVRNEVTCRVYSFLKQHLSKNDLDKLFLVKVPLATIIASVKRKYGYSNIMKLIKQYREYNFPIIPFRFQGILTLLRKK